MHDRHARQGAPKTLFSDGELAPRMLASAAMPVLYRPVAIDGEIYCDGALLVWRRWMQSIAVAAWTF